MIALAGCVYVTSHMPGAYKDTLRLESQMGVSCHVGAQNRTYVLCKSYKYALLMSHVFTPPFFLIKKKWCDAIEIVHWLLLQR